MGARLGKGPGSGWSSLEKMGCDRRVLEVLLSVKHDEVFQRNFSRFCDRLAPSPRKLRTIAARAERLADEFEILASSPIFHIAAPRSAKDLRQIASSITHLSVPATLRIRRTFSYRGMGKNLRSALLAYYIRKQTGRPCWKELADLLQENDPDKLQKACKGTTRRITFNDTLPDLMEALLSVAHSLAGLE